MSLNTAEVQKIASARYNLDNGKFEYFVHWKRADWGPEWTPNVQCGLELLKFWATRPSVYAFRLGTNYAYKQVTVERDHLGEVRFNVGGTYASSDQLEQVLRRDETQIVRVSKREVEKRGIILGGDEAGNFEVHPSKKARHASKAAHFSGSGAAAAGKAAGGSAGGAGRAPRGAPSALPPSEDTEAEVIVDDASAAVPHRP